MRGLTISEPTIADNNEKEVDLFPCSSQSGRSNLDRKHGGEDYYAVPGCLGSPWSDIERQGFLLGLYIFGKNLVQVKKFVDSERDGETYCCSIMGSFIGLMNIVDGWIAERQEAGNAYMGKRFLQVGGSRNWCPVCFPGMSLKNAKMSCSGLRTFCRGKILLEEYVTTLKSNVGLNILIDAVGIGRRKHDLTGIVQEPAKVNHVIPTQCRNTSWQGLLFSLTCGYHQVSERRFQVK
ncbi:hypothetical protein Scep_030658 [Stephania cephalantha]|uniref:DUF7952 domain-containing protein n=1 Tax=Stephania cephalantha TaxID=152367 RepID=A0AAP0E3H2_9MAGN